MPKILVVEDDPRVIEAIKKSFSLEAGFTCQSVSEAAGVLGATLAYKPDLILLDIKLSDGDGRQIIKSLKENVQTRRIPVIFLTGMSAEGDRVLGLNLGADDYIAKPFGAMELLARIQAVLRRVQRAPAAVSEAPLSGNGLLLDPVNRIAKLHGKSLKLQPKEFEVLYLLASRPGKTLTREFLLESASPRGTDFGSRSLDTHIKNLRKKLGPAAQWIETISKLGYRFNPPK